MAKINNTKTMQYANFNITFGNKLEPMLEYFEKIIYPAFKANYARKGTGNTKYFLKNIQVKEIDNEYVLVGNYIKDTIYNVYTQWDENEVKLIPKSKEIPTAPFSRFIIFLKNHRMAFVRNQAESPDIRSFQVTVKEVLKNYIKKNNKTLSKTNKLPYAIVNIVNIPLPKTIAERLQDIEKIESVKFRFFPLNNDINPLPLANNIQKEMEKAGSKTSNFTLNSPKSKGYIKTMLEKIAGLAEYTIKVKHKNGNKETLKEDSFTSKKSINLIEPISSNDDKYIAQEAKKDTIITQVSLENEKLYDKIKSYLESLTRI